MGGCCIGDCCVIDCGFCCILDFGSCGDCTVSSSYDNNTVEAKVNIAQELETLRSKSETDSLKAETEAIDYTSQFISNFVEELSKINNKNVVGENSLSLNIHEIKNEFDKLKSEVKGFIKSKMDENLVQTNKELADLFKIENQNERDKKIKKFYEEEMKKAKKALYEKIEYVANMQEKVVVDIVDERNKELCTNLVSLENAIKEAQNNASETAKNTLAINKKAFELECARMLLKEIQNQRS